MRRVMFVLMLMVAGLMASATSAAAQTDATTVYIMRTYVAGSNVPLSVQAYPTVVAVCNQAQPPVLTDTRIQSGVKFRVAFDDPGNPGRACIIDTANLTSPIFSLPVGYGPHEMTLELQVNGEVSGESNRAPFRLTPAPVRGVRVVTGS
jgi:hypothetical protein